MNPVLRNVVALAAASLLHAGCGTPSTAQDKSGKLEVQWLGQTSMKVTTPGGKVIVIDPFLTNNPKTPPEYKNLDALGKVDLILVSHGHMDHSADAPALAKKNNVQFVDMKFIDFPGIWQHTQIPAHRLTEALFEDGLAFDGSSVRGWQPINASDMVMIPDPESAKLDPFFAHPTLSLTCSASPCADASYRPTGTRP